MLEIKDLASVVAENRKNMIQMFKQLLGKKSKLIGKEGKFLLARRYQNSPYILLDVDGDSEIRDFGVVGVKLDEERDRFVFYVTKDLWYYSTECLSLSENNVYLAMYEIIKKEGNI